MEGQEIEEPFKCVLVLQQILYVYFLLQHKNKLMIKKVKKILQVK